MGTFPYRRPKASSRDSQENSDKRKDRQAISRSVILNSIHEHDSYVNEKVTFDTQDSLEEKIDTFTTMMSNLTTQDNGQKKQFKPKIYQGKRRRQIKNSMTEKLSE